MTPAAPPVLSLPSELLLGIVEYVPRPRNQEALCLASRKLNDVAIPLLYASVHVDVNDGASLSASTGVFAPNNRGLRFTRYLSFDPATGEIESPATALKIMSIALKRFPSDTLKRVFMPEKLAVNSVFLEELATRQPNLDTIQYGLVNTALANILPRTIESVDWTASLRTLELPDKVGGINDLIGFNLLIQHAENLTGLRLANAVSLDDEASAIDTTWSDTSAEPGLYVRTLFSHIALLGTLQDRKTTVRYLDLWLDEFTNMRKVTQFLKRCFQIRHLQLDYFVRPGQKAALPDAAVLSQNKATLEVLHLDVKEALTTDLVQKRLMHSPLKYVRGLVKALPGLVGLSLPFPSNDRTL